MELDIVSESMLQSDISMVRKSIIYMIYMEDYSDLKFYSLYRIHRMKNCGFHLNMTLNQDHRNILRNHDLQKRSGLAMKICLLVCYFVVLFILGDSF